MGKLPSYVAWVTAAALYRIKYVVPFQFGLALCLEMVEVARALPSFSVAGHVEQEQGMARERRYRVTAHQFTTKNLGGYGDPCSCYRVLTHRFTSHPITSDHATHTAMIASARGHSQREAVGR